MTGLLLAGIGHVDNQQKKNFLIVDASESYYLLASVVDDNRADTYQETQTNVIESAFQDYTERKDIAILLINQHVSVDRLALDHCIQQRACADSRLPRRYVLQWIDIRLLSPHYWRFPARSILTVGSALTSSDES